MTIKHILFQLKSINHKNSKNYFISAIKIIYFENYYLVIRLLSMIQKIIENSYAL